MLAMILKEFRELRRDRRTLAMLIVLPILFLVVFGFAANFTITTLTAGVFGPQATQVEQQLKSNPQAAGHFDVVETDTSGTAADARQFLVDGKANIAISTGDAKPTVYIDGSNIFAAASNENGSGIGLPP